jgi:hypothetical protein
VFDVIARSEATKQSTFFSDIHGLLRFARNDGVKTGCLKREEVSAKPLVGLRGLIPRWSFSWRRPGINTADRGYGFRVRAFQRAPE